MNLQLMRLIGRICGNDSEYQTADQSRILPALRLSVAFLAVLLCALSRNAVFVIMIIAAELLWLSMKSPIFIWKTLKPVLIAVFFCFVLMLPAVFMGHPRTLLTVSMKVFESVLILSQLENSIRWQKMTDAFRTLHLPQLFVFTLRRVGPDHWKTAGTGGILGTTFLRSQKMSMETSEAMACRCFDGEYRSYRRSRFGRPDAVYAMLIPLLIVLFIYTQQAM